ncbi:hypothetical protein MN116_005465 [Schistosoma mekongi]|uniref:Uncharacterized protein n=1 Tax=Schistosoma mekongi TaxID=38744 RepID=A0AAE1ZDW9_SCHME|nr:hypothetical protein MN116_005465 [Schistosoma mekongi]
MEFNRNTIRQIGYYTPTYSNSPNIKRNNEFLLNNYQSESYGLNNLIQIQMKHNLPMYQHGNPTNIEQNNEHHLKSNRLHNNNNNNHLRINHTLDGKTQLIYETPSRTRQYWLDRRKLSSTNRINNNNNNTDDSVINSNKTTLIKTNHSMFNDHLHSRIITSNSNNNNNNNYYYYYYSLYPLNKDEKQLNYIEENNNELHNNELHLYELTENELILSKLDPRINLTNSMIIKTNKIELFNNNEKNNFCKQINNVNDNLPIYQSIESIIDQIDIGRVPLKTS